MTPRFVRARSIVIAALFLGIGVAHAQPQSQGKVDAKSLMQSGVRLLEAKDYLGALAVFKDAYVRFPSAKILLNIGTTLSLLDRKAEAANAYQRYLDSEDADRTKQSDVTTALVELDKAVGKLEISVTPADAELQINDGEWQPAARARLFRVPDGQFTVRARKDRFNPEAKSAKITSGEKAAIAIALTAVPDAPVIGANTGGGSAGGIVGGPTDDGVDDRSRIGGIAVAHLDIPRTGGAVLVGITVDITGPLQVEAAAILGPAYGAFAGARFAFLTGTVRPLIAAGMPIFFSDGARIGVRGAGGVELQITKHVSLVAELGVEVMLNPEDDILKAAFIPAVGATGRL